MTTEIKLSVSEEGLIRVLPSLFSSEDAFLKEIAQNAQRSGASEIHFTTVKSGENRVLLIEDDGCGFTLEGFEKFFCIGKSGWESEQAKSQKPFGMGAGAMFFASEEAVIWSNDLQVTFSGEGLVNNEPAIIEEVDYLSGTMIALSLKNKVVVSFSKMKKLFRGFTIPVFYNGVEIDRFDSLDSCPKVFVDAPFGKIYIPKVNNNGSVIINSECPLVSTYAQGLQFYTNRFRNRSSYNPNVLVHLNASDYQLRAPDRVQLCEGASGLDNAIEEFVCNEYKNRLLQEKERLGVSEFALAYWESCVELSPNLLLDCPVPERLLIDMNDLPYYTGDDDNHPVSKRDTDNLFHSPKDIDCLLFSNRDGFIVQDDHYSGDCELQESAVLSAIHLAEHAMVNSLSIPDGHWFNKLIIRDELRVKLEVVGSDFVRDLIVCDDLKGAVYSEDTGIKIFAFNLNSDPACFFSQIYVPRRARHSLYGLNVALRQRESFSIPNDHCWEINEHHLDEVTDELIGILESYFCDDPTQVITKAFENSQHMITAASVLLAGKTMTISFDDEGNLLPIAA